MTLMTTHVEENISKALSDCYDLVIEKQTISQARFVAISATLPASTDQGYSEVCLAMSLREDEIKRDVDEHILFINFVLPFYLKMSNHVFAIFGYNCTAKQSISSTLSP